MHDPERAAQAYQAGDQLWRQGQPEAALASLITAIALHPEHPNAKNFAGWLLTTRHRHEPAAVAQGLALLAEAHALAVARAFGLREVQRVARCWPVSPSCTQAATREFGRRGDHPTRPLARPTTVAQKPLKAALRAF